MLAYYDISKAVIVLYDTSNETSFSNVELWIDSVQESSSNCPLILLVGNKMDNKESVVTKEMIDKLTLKYGIAHFEISSSNQESTGGLLDYIASEMSIESPSKKFKYC